MYRSFYIRLLVLICITGVFNSALFAQPVSSSEELAKESENPVAKLISVPFNSNFNFGYGDPESTQYILDIKPVIPFSLNTNWNLITRTIFPVMHQQKVSSTGQRSYINGMSDITPTFFLSPAHPEHLIWGVGPAIVLPTATEKQLGQGKYSIGPSIVALIMPGNWVAGFLVFNVWSVGGQSNRPNVNQLELQYFVNYNFPHGWYVTTQPIILANWTETADNRWTVPFGLGAGRVFKIAEQAVNVSLQAYDNVKTPKAGGANWQAQFNINLLFPKA